MRKSKETTVSTAESCAFIPEARLIMNDSEANWLDHSRDMLHMINYFRDSMPQPLMGVGHSMGATQIVHLSILHPRLLHSLALIEPIILENGPKEGPNVALASSFRKDFWATRDAAEASIRKSKFFGTWNKRALEKYIEHGLRSTPTALYPDHKHSGGTTLTTTKHQEAWSFLRPNFAPNDGSRDEHIRAPDSSPEHRTHLFHRAEMASANRNLPFVRPHVLWIFGEKSAVSAPEFREDKLKRTGTGVGGSGGQAMGQVEAVTISDGQHMLPFERTQELAQILADWIEKQLESYRKEEDWHRKNKSGKSERNMLALSESWLKNVKQKENTPRPKI